MKKYVIFFTQRTKIKGGRNGREKFMSVRAAKGPIDAFRKATGWKGRVSAGKGYSHQTPARQIQAYIPWIEGETATEHVQRARGVGFPPTAYVVPLGSW